MSDPSDENYISPELEALWIIHNIVGYASTIFTLTRSMEFFCMFAKFHPPAALISFVAILCKYLERAFCARKLFVRFYLIMPLWTATCACCVGSSLSGRDSSAHLFLISLSKMTVSTIPYDDNTMLILISWLLQDIRLRESFCRAVILHHQLRYHPCLTLLLALIKCSYVSRSQDLAWAVAALKTGRSSPQ